MAYDYYGNTDIKKSVKIAIKRKKSIVNVQMSMDKIIIDAKSRMQKKNKYNTVYDCPKISL